MADKDQTIIIKKKKGGGHAAAHGGAWKVAYADFVTAMMCFFLVMWLMGSDEEIKATVTHYFNTPNSPYKDGRDPNSNVSRPLGERQGEGNDILMGAKGMFPDDLVERPVRPVISVDDLLADNESIADLLHELLGDKLSSLEVSIDYLRFSVPDSALFQPGSASLDAAAQKLMGRVGLVFKGFKGHVQVAHADAPDANSYEFGMARSVSVMRYLVDHRWVAEDRISPGRGRELASVEGTGPSTKPRRIEFTLRRPAK